MVEVDLHMDNLVQFVGSKMEDLVVVDQMVVVVLETLLNHLVLVMKVEQDSSSLEVVAVPATILVMVMMLQIQPVE